MQASTIAERRSAVAALGDEQRAVGHKVQIDAIGAQICANDRAWRRQITGHNELEALVPAHTTVGQVRPAAVLATERPARNVCCNLKQNRHQGNAH